MAINIKNAQTETLVKELAELTGQSITMVITLAVRDRLERERNKRKGSSRIDKLRGIARRCAGGMLIPTRSEDVADLLYDSNGLPK